MSSVPDVGVVVESSGKRLICPMFSAAGTKNWRELLTELHPSFSDFLKPISESKHAEIAI
jgi:hypothetical protein